MEAEEALADEVVAEEAAEAAAVSAAETVSILHTWVKNDDNDKSGWSTFRWSEEW